MRPISMLFACCAGVLSTSAVQAATPGELRAAYAREAAAVSPGYSPSAQRGAEFFSRRFAVSDRMPACVSCHSERPLASGKHAVTGKIIQPMAVSGNPERFTDGRKVEKWFLRNCREVVGRECSAGEKADFVAYMMEVR